MNLNCKVGLVKTLRKSITYIIALLVLFNLPEGSIYLKIIIITALKHVDIF